MTQAAQLAAYGSQGVALGFKNRIINGAMMIDQRNGGASVSTPNGKYITDRFECQTYRTSATVQQIQDAPTGLYYSLKYTNDSTGGAPSAGNTLCFIQAIEGYNATDLGFGATGASAVTLSFWVKSSITGTYGLGLTNGSSADTWYTATRSYVATYTINTANTWEYKTITISGDVAGTWGKTNGVGIDVVFDIGSGTTYETTSGAWTTGGFNRTSACVKLGSTASATFQITGIQLEKGTVATSFDYRDYGRELAMCQRYYFPLLTNPTAYMASWHNGSARIAGTFPVTMRAAPTAIFVGSTGNGDWFSTIDDSNYRNLGGPVSGGTTLTGFNIKLTDNGGGIPTPASGPAYIQGSRAASYSAEL